MSDNSNSNHGLLFLLGGSVVIFIVGFILLQMGYNEAFYVENEAVRDIFEVITLFGHEYSYIIFFTIFFFGINKEFGKNTILCFLTSFMFTDFFKNWFQDPRPPANVVDGELVEEGFGLPSGHTSGTISFWGFTGVSAAKSPKNKLALLLSIILVILVPISRLVIGVHDLQDVVYGFLVGSVVLIFYSLTLPKFKKMAENWGAIQKIALGSTLALVSWIIACLLLAQKYPSGLVTPIGEVIDARETMGQSAGFLLGIAIAIPLESKYVQFNPKELDGKQKVIAVLIGMVITFGLYLGLSAVMGSLEPAYIWRMIRYTIVALGAGLLAPMLIVKILRK